MLFGRVNDSLETIDFTLPQDAELTKKTLASKGGPGELTVHVGASKWGEKSWKGKIYPKNLSDNEYLKVYTQNFNTIELNLTFYNIYGAEQLKRWASQAADSPGFKFCPKFPQQISHIRRFKNAQEYTEKFYESLPGLGDHLGPMWIQLGDNFSPKTLHDLKAYLQALPSTQRVNLEIRHKDWFVNDNERKELYNLLYDLNIGTVIVDSAGRRDCVHMELTTPEAFIRFVGNNLHDSDYKRMDAWVERLKDWTDQGLKSIWFFMHQNDERYVPEACVYFINQLNAKLGTAVEVPKMIVE